MADASRPVARKRARPAPLVVVDGTNALIRNFFAYPDLRSPSGRPTGATFGVANRIREAVELFEPARVVVCWDRGRAAWRRAVFAGYKDRSESSSSLDLADCFAQKPDLLELLGQLGCDSVEADGVEADDLVAWYALRYTEPDAWGGCVIVSTDRDFYQLVGDTTSVYYGAAPGKGRDVEHVTLETFRDATSSAKLPGGTAGPGEWAAYRIVNGDSSDRIPGVRGLSGEKRWAGVYPALVSMGYAGDALEFFIARGDYAGSFDAFDEATLPHARAVAENWSLLERNAILMDLWFSVGMLESKGVDPERHASAGAWDERAAERACGRHNFQTAVRAWTRWVDAFGAMAARRRA